MKQETLEEFINQTNTPEGLDQFSYDKGLEDGSKWQQEQNNKLYSEEEVREAVNWEAMYEESLSMQRTSNAGYESKINELKEKIKTMYSKEDMWEAYKNSNTVFDNKDSLREEFEEWFEQFKKK
jgi:hypothetical protein